MLVAKQAGLANNAHAQDVQNGVGVRGDLCHSLRTKAFCANNNNLNAFCFAFKKKRCGGLGMVLRLELHHYGSFPSFYPVRMRATGSSDWSCPYNNK